MTKPRHLNIDQAIDFAQKELNRGNVSNAIQLYQAVLKQYPTHPVAKEGLRKLQENLSDYDSVQVTSTNSPQD